MEGLLTKEDFLDEDRKWQCIKCGSCCLDVSLILPEFADPDGVCKYLGGDNECTIYEERPEVCRFTGLGMTDNQKALLCEAIFKHMWGNN